MFTGSYLIRHEKFKSSFAIMTNDGIILTKLIYTHPCMLYALFLFIKQELDRIVHFNSIQILPNRKLSPLILFPCVFLYLFSTLVRGGDKAFSSSD